MGTRNGKVFLSDECEDQRTQEMTRVDTSEITNSWSTMHPIVRGKGQAVDGGTVSCPRSCRFQSFLYSGKTSSV